MKKNILIGLLTILSAMSIGFGLNEKSKAESVKGALIAKNNVLVEQERQIQELQLAVKDALALAERERENAKNLHIKMASE